MATTEDKIIVDSASVEEEPVVVDDDDIEESMQKTGEEVLEDDDAAVHRVLNIKRGIMAFASVLCLALCFITLGDDPKINQTLAIALYMAALWLTEYIPLVVTAFIPLFMFPFFGILSAATAAENYANNTIFLFISGFMAAFTLERWDLHKRFALKVVSICGAQPGALLFGMMLATFILSMFVSNTATTIMMVPNAISVIDSLERTTADAHRHEIKRFGVAAMLGICYAANVGGMSSVIGTPPNLVFQAQLAVIFPDSPEVTFANWIGVGLPIGMVSFAIIWVYLKIVYLRGFQGEAAPRDFFRNEYLALGEWYKEQIVVVIAFVLLALLWIFRPDIAFGSFTIKGWRNIFPEPTYIADATIGMAVAVFLFICPARSSRLPGAQAAPGRSEKYDTTLLDWDTANRGMPYDILFLFGGGFTLAKAFLDSGLSSFLGDKLAAMDISLGGQVFIVTFTIIWLTELTSNTATSNIMIPLSAALAVAAEVSPYTFMIPTTLACSCAFCLPIATPPNMIAFSSGRLPLIEMNKAGVFLNIICSFLILGLVFTIVPAVLDVEADEFPEWANI